MAIGEIKVVSNKKRKCKFCLEYKEAEKGVKVPAGFFCSIGHAISFAHDKQAKQKQRQIAKDKQSQIKKEKAVKTDLRARKEKLKSATDWNKEAQTAINKYVRIRDLNKPCVSCGCSLSVSYGGTTDCGHYRSRGSASHLRFNLFNMASQCSRCNRYLSGNIVEYRKELINRIGIERVELLENDNKPRKFDTEYFKRVKSIFNKRARLYEKKFRY